MTTKGRPSASGRLRNTSLPGVWTTIGFPRRRFFQGIFQPFRFGDSDDYPQPTGNDPSSDRCKGEFPLGFLQVVNIYGFFFLLNINCFVEIVYYL